MIELLDQSSLIFLRTVILVVVFVVGVVEVQIAVCPHISVRNGIRFRLGLVLEARWPFVLAIVSVEGDWEYRLIGRASLLVGTSVGFEVFLL